MNQEKIARINELARLSRTRSLTEEEAAEQKTLRQEYLDEIRRSFTAELDNTVVVEPDGTKYPLSDLKKKKG